MRFECVTRLLDVFGRELLRWPVELIVYGHDSLVQPLDCPQELRLQFAFCADGVFYVIECFAYFALACVRAGDVFVVLFFCPFAVPAVRLFDLSFVLISDRVDVFFCSQEIIVAQGPRVLCVAHVPVQFCEALLARLDRLP